VGEFSLSAGGRILAYVRTTAPAGLDWATNRMRCHTELAVRDLASGDQRVWTVPTGATVQGLQLSPDATRLVYLLERTPGADLPAAGDCPVSMWRFQYDQRPATAYVFRDGNLRRVPFDGDCWQADW
jgi:hypothetical protein